VLLSCVGIVACSLSCAQSAPRSFEVDDLMHMEALGKSFKFAPDGRMAAFRVARAVQTDLGHHFIFANDRSDIWLFDADTGTSSNLTQGAAGRESFWYPAWSPDGTRLAMFSTRAAPEGRVRVWIWDRATGHLTHLSERYADVTNDTGVNEVPHKLLWLSNSVLAFRSLPAGVPTTEGRTPRQMMRFVADEWAEAVRGEKPTGVVFESGRVLERKDLTHGESFVACEVGSGRCADVLESYIGDFIYDGLESTLVPAPGGQVVAAISLDSSWPPNPLERQLRMNGNRYRLQLFTRNGSLSPGALEKMRNVVPGSLRWSADGKRLAFFGSTDPSLDVVGDRRGANSGPSDLYVLQPGPGQLQRVDLGGLTPTTDDPNLLHRVFKLAWADNDPVVRAREPGDEAGAPTPRHEGWWRMVPGHAPVNLTAALGFVPADLYPALDRDTFVCAGKGNLWLLSAAGRPRQLTAYSASIRQTPDVRWLDSDPASGALATTLVYRIDDWTGSSGSDADLVSGSVHYLDLRSGRDTVLQAPSAQASFVELSFAAHAAVFVEIGRSGSRAWRVPLGGGKPTLFFETNTFLRDVAEGETRKLEYTDLEGHSQTGWVILPPGYRAARKYPLVTWVYQGETYAQRPELSHISMLNPLNMQLLAAKGYVVLFPSMPGKMQDYGRLRNGVMPAIDKVIALGIADPERLAVMGQSNGGFSTYGLITQTNRFKAAIALAGFTDLYSISLQFEGNYLQREFAENSDGRLRMMEAHMGFGLPWQDESYLRNSPISYVANVHTPLLQLHGDMDGVPVQQAQEFFTAMQRLGKRAKLVEYIGDDHVFHSPANIRDSWQQIFAWLAQFMPGTP
jgi:dipeptidyl aminopeptidase/acylaminoacyl peptidase